MAPDAAVPRAPPGARARYAGAHLLQVRGHLAGRLAQAEHRRPAGLRERAGRASSKLATETGRGPVGLVAGVRVRAVRAGVRGVHGRLVLRPEALPALDDADLGRDACTARRQHADRGRPRAGSRTRPARSGIAISEAVEIAAAARGHELRAGLGAQPRAAAPDGDRPGGDRADGDGRRGARRRDRAASAAARTSAGWRSRSCAGCCAARHDALRRRRARGVPDADARRLPLRLRRHGRADAADADVHARPRLRAAAGARRRAALPRRLAAACRRWSRRASSRRARYRQNETLRGGRAVRPHRGHHPGARAVARDPAR